MMNANTCPHCLRDLQNAMTMTCLHILCSRCIAHRLENDLETCPVCNADIRNQFWVFDPDEIEDHFPRTYPLVFKNLTNVNGPTGEYIYLFEKDGYFGFDFYFAFTDQAEQQRFINFFVENGEVTARGHKISRAYQGQLFQMIDEAKIQHKLL